MEFTLSLNEQELNIIVAGLGKLPLEAALPVFQKIKQQAEDQAKQNPGGTD